MIIKKFKFGSLKIHNTYVISELNEGVQIDINIANTIILEANNYFNGKPWGYISNRIHSYSINPVIYTELLRLRKTIVAYAVVSYRRETEIIAIAEQVFIGSDYNFQVFDNLPHAITWVDSVVKQARIS